MNRTQKSVTAGLCVFFCVGIVIGGRAQNPETSPVPIETILRMRSFGVGLRTFSPDGKWIAYTVRAPQEGAARGDAFDYWLQTGVGLSAFGSDIWITEIDTGTTRSITEGKGSNWLPSWSPDGRYLAFLSDRDGTDQARVWIWDAEKNKLQKVSEVAVRMHAQQAIEWMPDSVSLLVTSVPEGMSVAQYVGAVKGGAHAPARTDSGSTALLYVSPPPAGESLADPINLDESLRDLIRIDVKTGEAKTLVRGKRIGFFHLTSDGRRVAYSTPERFEAAGSQQSLHSLSVLTFASGEDRPIASGVRLGLTGNFSLSPDGGQIAFRATGAAEKVRDIYTIRVSGGPARNLTHFADQQDPSRQNGRGSFSLVPLWEPRGEFLYFLRAGNLWRTSAVSGKTEELTRIAGHSIRQLIGQSPSVIGTLEGGLATMVLTRENESKREGLYSIDLRSGRALALLEANACLTCQPGVTNRLAAIAPTGRMVAYITESANEPPDLWVTDVAGRGAKRLTNLNPELGRYKLGQMKSIDWLDDDGEHLEGSLLLPSDYVAGRRCPLVVLIYGGAYMSGDKNTFGGFERGMRYFHTQLLATRGYAVLMPDAPQHEGTPMLDLAKTVLPAVNRAIEIGIADPNRLGLMGHSYGGYSTLSLIVQTKRFKAALEANGIGNLLGSYGQMNRDGTAFGTSTAETGQNLMGVTPWQNRERYIENSPFFYLDRVQTPILLIHGDEDSSVPSFLGDEIFVALRRLGKTAEYVKYEREGHEYSAFANQLDVARRMLRWFELYLRSQ